MKTRLLKKLRLEAKNEFYIIDKGRSFIDRYEVRQQYKCRGLSEPYTNSFFEITEAMKELKKLRYAYIKNRLFSYRRKKLDL